MNVWLILLAVCTAAGLIVAASLLWVGISAIYAKFAKSAVKTDLATVEQAITDFQNETAMDRRAFCVHAMVKSRS